MPTVLISTAVSLLILKITYHIYNLKLYIQNDASFESLKREMKKKGKVGILPNNMILSLLKYQKSEV